LILLIDSIIAHNLDYYINFKIENINLFTKFPQQGFDIN